MDAASKRRLALTSKGQHHVFSLVDNPGATGVGDASAPADNMADTLACILTHDIDKGMTRVEISDFLYAHQVSCSMVIMKLDKKPLTLEIASEIGTIRRRFLRFQRLLAELEQIIEELTSSGLAEWLD